MKSEFERQVVWEWHQQKLMAAASDIVQAVGKKLAAVHSVVGKRGISWFSPSTEYFKIYPI